jgi:hypothetical protein
MVSPVNISSSYNKTPDSAVKYFLLANFKSEMAEMANHLFSLSCLSLMIGMRNDVGKKLYLGQKEK